MPLSVRLPPEEEALLDAVARQTLRSRSELVRQGVRELCQRLARADKTPYDMGAHLFGNGVLAAAPNDPVKRAVWEKLRAKHHRVG
jgi:Arc/MetJ-type ribon-helix-helix transcriptional regulator